MAHKGEQRIQNKSTVTADCVFYISASQEVEVCVCGGAVYAEPCNLHLHSLIQIQFCFHKSLKPGYVLYILTICIPISLFCLFHNYVKVSCQPK